MTTDRKDGAAKIGDEHEDLQPNRSLSDVDWEHQSEELLELLVAGNLHAIELTQEITSTNPPPWCRADQVNALMFDAAADLLQGST
ncbi:hypothetical protein ACTUVN_003670 [Pseudomonas caspiana]